MMTKAAQGPEPDPGTWESPSRENSETGVGSVSSFTGWHQHLSPGADYYASVRGQSRARWGGEHMETEWKK